MEILKEDLCLNCDFVCYADCSKQNLFVSTYTGIADLLSTIKKTHTHLTLNNNFSQKVPGKRQVD